MTAFDGSQDFTGDHLVDLIVRTPSGQLVLYRGTGTGLAGGVVIGTGWTGMVALS